MTKGEGMYVSRRDCKERTRRNRSKITDGTGVAVDRHVEKGRQSAAIQEIGRWKEAREGECRWHEALEMDVVGSKHGANVHGCEDKAFHGSEGR